MITAAVLAGGLGRRLQPVVPDRPKVLATVAGRPFLSYLLEQLVEAGVGKAVLCTGYLAEQVRVAFGGSFGAMRLCYSQEQRPLGTAGALRQALPLLDSDPVLVLNGDSYCDVDLFKFCAWRRRLGAAAAIVLAQVPDVSRFGSIACGPDQRVTRFGEKCGSGAGWINAGVYLIRQDLLSAIPESAPCSLEHDCFPRWVATGVYGYPHARRFLDIGTASSYAEAETFFAAMASRTGPIPNASGRRYVLLDRDGTLNVERNYLSDPADLELMPGTAEALAALQEIELGLVVITNQSAVGRGYLDVAQLDRIHARLRRLLSAEGVVLDGIYYCPHTPQDGCACRKPGTGLVEKAAADLGFDPRQSFVVGDQRCDMELGTRLGATTILVRTGHGAQQQQVQADHVVEDLRAAAELILRMLERPAALSHSSPSRHWQ